MFNSNRLENVAAPTRLLCLIVTDLRCDFRPVNNNILRPTFASSRVGGKTSFVHKI